MSKQISKNFSCSICYHTITTPIDESEIDNASNKPDGLITHTAYHRCATGGLTVTNLKIDKRNNLHSYRNLTLPVKFKPEPVPWITNTRDINFSTYETINLSSLPSRVDFRLVVIDYHRNYCLIVGNIETEQDKESQLIHSKDKRITLAYYPSKVKLEGPMRMWLTYIANSLENEPIPKLGVIVDIFDYAINKRYEYPGDFEKRIMKSMLTSHRVTYDLLKEPDAELLEYLLQKYGKKDMDYMVRLLDHLKHHPGSPLITFTKLNISSFDQLIAKFYLLETEEIVKVHQKVVATVD